MRTEKVNICHMRDELIDLSFPLFLSVSICKERREILRRDIISPCVVKWEWLPSKKLFRI